MIPYPLWAHEDDFEHFHLGDDDNAAMAQAIADHDIVVFTTVGIDIGSSTTHLLFATVTLAREALDLSARFTVVGREVRWRSPITFTPFLPNGSIDAATLVAFVDACYDAAGLTAGEVDCGAVILTGEAIKRENARAIDELFAARAGAFVCATAGHHLEAMLAAHGSGAVRLSRQRDCVLLHVDIGGGTTKLARIDRGRIAGVAAFAAGGRLLARDAAGAWTRVDDAARRTAAAIGLGDGIAWAADPAARAAVTARFAEIIVDYISGTPRDDLGRALLLTGELEGGPSPTAVSFSGGVAEYLFGREHGDFGDIARDLAAGIRAALPERLAVPVLDPGVGIRATAIGASQFTIQVSGTTVFVSGPDVLPLRNVPVIAAELPGTYTREAIAAAIETAIGRYGARRDAPLALAINWDREPIYADVAQLCAAIAAAFAGTSGSGQAPLVLLIDGDIAQTIGHILYDELAFARPLVALDGVRLADLDFVDVSEPVMPAGVIPLVIKSLVFA